MSTGNHVSTLMLWLLLVSNTTLGFVVIIKLHTTPLDVLVSLKRAELTVQVVVDELSAKQALVSQELDARRRWMNDITGALRTASADRWRKSDEEKVWDELFDTNPTLSRPSKFWIDEKPQVLLELPTPPSAAPMQRKGTQHDH